MQNNGALHTTFTFVIPTLLRTYLACCPYLFMHYLCTDFWLQSWGYSLLYVSKPALTMIYSSYLYIAKTCQ